MSTNTMHRSSHVLGVFGHLKSIHRLVSEPPAIENTYLPGQEVRGTPAIENTYLPGQEVRGTPAIENAYLPGQELRGTTCNRPLHYDST